MCVIRNVRKVIIQQNQKGADGLLLKDGILTMVVNGKKNMICRLMSTDQWRTATIMATTPIDDRDNYRSTATNNGENVWLINTRYNDIRIAAFCQPILLCNR